MRLSRRISEEKKYRYLILGSSRGCGTTHTAFVLCEYLSQSRGCKACYIEMDRNGSVGTLPYPTDETVENLPEKTEFHYHNIRVFSSRKWEELPLLLQQPYDAFLIDAGNVEQLSQKELWLVDRIFIVCSSAPWKERKLAIWLDANQESEQIIQGCYLLPGATFQKAKSYTRRYGRKFYAVPYIQEPHQLGPSVVTAMKQWV